ncbi:MAG: glycosyltransferase family 39 protein [Lachnospiraceae bacterium]|nr:glycosyltransferase family 39 protein [Lachnospiraceae bacterium]
MKYIKKHAVFIFFLIEALVIGFFQTLGNTDKLWNYVFAENIASGLLPYRDFNLLQTPFSCLVNALFLTIFGHHVVVIEILGSVLFTLICMRLYGLCRELGATRIASMIIPQVFLYLFCYNVFFEYSCLILFLQLCLLSADLIALRGQKKLWDRPLYQLALGVAAGLAILSKQTYGVFVAGVSWLGCLYTSVCLKKTKKETGVLLAARTAGILIPCLCFLFYLLITGTFADFWDMAVAGISTFTSKYSYLKLAQEGWGEMAACVGAPILIFVSLIIGVRRRKELYGQTLLVILLYGAGGLINLYPLANSYHFSTTLIPFLLLIPALLPASLWQKRPVCLLGGTVVAAALCFLVVRIPYDVTSSNHLSTTLDQFEGVFVSTSMEEDILEVTAYVQDQQEDGMTVYILDNRAASYFLPLHQYHKYYDMFLLGNLGTTPPEELLEEACQEDVIFLVPNSEKQEWQYPRSAVNTLKKELLYAGSVGDFDVYRTKG